DEQIGVGVIVIFLGLIGVAVALNRRGHVYSAAIYFIGVYTVLATIGLELDVQSTSSSSLWDWMALMVAPIVAGFILPFWAPLVFAALVILDLVGIYSKQFPFTMAALNANDQIDLISFIFFITFMFAILSSVYAHNVKRGFQEADRSLELENANRELEVARVALQQLSLTDPLTGIPNHRAFTDAADQAIDHARLTQEPVAFLFLDGDHFKHINDTYGHAVGDATLQHIARQMQQTLRPGDFVARYGGEEFVVLLPATDHQEAGIIAERIRAAIANTPVAPTSPERIGVTITASVGYAVYPMDGNTLAEVVQRADQAMYVAKHQGRNRVCGSADLAQRAQNEMISATQQPAA
ncbi:MAG TPA: diguanylate cyclase, partial [Ktedonobacterales bacterium]|nr:diguanylate cyclase [Ktedonobacterales bacterium]